MISISSSPLVREYLQFRVLKTGRVTTALHEMEDHMRAVDVGGDDVLTKPINKLELLLRVKSLLRVRELMGELEAQRHLIHHLLKSYVSAEAAARFLADPASVGSLEALKARP